MAWVGDLIAKMIFLVANKIGIPYNQLYITGPRITLWLASFIVLGAAVYAFRTLEWRQCEEPECRRRPRQGGARRCLTPMRITLPASRTDLAELAVGDEVLLSGPVFTARDAGHERLLAALDETGELPFGLAGQVLFYAGPTPPAAGRPFGAVGPTTASRMDSATPRLLEAGIVATIGKGARSPEVAEACARTGSVYFAAVGGAAALLARHVVSAEPVAWEDLGTEALQRLTLARLPRVRRDRRAGQRPVPDGRGGVARGGSADETRAAHHLRGRGGDRQVHPDRRCSPSGCEAPASSCASSASRAGRCSASRFATSCSTQRNEGMSPVTELLLYEASRAAARQRGARARARLGRGRPPRPLLRLHHRVPGLRPRLCRAARSTR